MLLWLILGSAAGAEASTETRLKASFVFNFVQFTQWPEQPGEITVCSLAADRPEAEFNVFDELRSRYPALATRRVRTTGEFGTCQVALLEATQAAHLSSVLASTSGRPVLVIADFESGVPLGAALGLVPAGGGRIGFDVNLAAARKAGLLLSSRLLQLARRVY